MEFKLPRWEELPDMDLYLEQVLSLLDQWLGGRLPGRSKKVLTRTMVNNYVKQKIIPAPVNKKYEKRSVAALFLIAYLKSIYAISDIARLISLAMSKDDMAVAYNKFCEFTEQAVGEVYADAEGYEEMDYLMKSVAGSFACQLFVMKEHLKK
ncbi:MAG: DUF1836 domain-containing protein [Anaerovoracaceae bacterium]|jgi:hypothetical protein